MASTLIDLLVERNTLSTERRQHVENIADEKGIHPLVALTAEEFVSWGELVRLLDEAAGVPSIEFRARQASPDLLNRFSIDDLRRWLAVPLEIREGVMTIALGDPINPQVKEALQAKAGMPVECYGADPQLLHEFLQSVSSSARVEEDAEDAFSLEGELEAPASFPAPSESDLSMADEERATAAPAPAGPTPAKSRKKLAPPAPKSKEPRSRKARSSRGRSVRDLDGAAEPTLGESSKESESDHRHTTVNYFKKMYQHENYPLTVVIAKGKIELRGEKGSSTIHSEEAWKVDKNDTWVEVVPCFPGCLTVPPRQIVDVSHDSTEARFFITPMVLTKLPDACLEVWQGGRCLDRVATPSKITRQWITRIAGVLTVLVGITMALARFRDSSMAQSLEKQLPAFDGLASQLGTWGETVGGLSNLGLIATGALTLITGIFYVDRRPARAKPVEAEIEC